MFLEINSTAYLKKKILIQLIVSVVLLVSITVIECGQLSRYKTVLCSQEDSVYFLSLAVIIRTQNQSVDQTEGPSIHKQKK